MEKEVMPLGPIEANCIILWNDPAKAWIVDPGADAEAVVAFCEKRGLVPALVALTHGHFDHIGAVPDLVAKWPGLAVHLAPADEVLAFSPLNAWPPHYTRTERPSTLVADLVEGSVLECGGLSAKVLSTPGHTPGSVCLHFEGEGLMLTGDTLFAGSCGRTDFPGGSMKEMSASLKRLATLPPSTEVVPGHGCSTTIAREVQTNPFMVG